MGLFKECFSPGHSVSTRIFPKESMEFWLSLHNPADQLASDTATFVQQIANGGLEAYRASNEIAGDADQEADCGEQSVDQRLVHFVHTKNPNVRFIKNYAISGVKDIPGSMTQSKKGRTAGLTPSRKQWRRRRRICSIMAS